MHQVRNFYGSSDENTYWNYLLSDETTLALFLKITPSADWIGTVPVQGFTSWSSPIFLDSHDLWFKPTSALMPSAIETATSQPSNFELQGAFSFSGIDERDLMAGKYSNANVEFFRMNPNDLSMGEEILFSGFISSINSHQDNGFSFNLESESALLKTNTGVKTTNICRSVKDFTYLGNNTCGYNNATSGVGNWDNQAILTVSSVPDRNHIVLTRNQDVPNDFYSNGRIEAVSSLNEGISREIQTATGQGTDFVNVTLKREFPLAVSVGDTFELTVGCNGTHQRCKQFGNVINRQAEDFVPHIEGVMRKRLVRR